MDLKTMVNKNMGLYERNLRLITEIFPQSSGDMFFTTLLEKTLPSALFSYSGLPKYHELDGKKEIKITSNTSEATTGIRPPFQLYPVCARTVPSCLVPLLMKN